MNTVSLNSDWDPKLYRRFQSERLRAAKDLLSRIELEEPSLIVDLGCGDGEVTRAIAGQWPYASVAGLDNSEAMIEKARSFESRIDWNLQDIRSWNPSVPIDLIFCNASLHWLRDHDRLFTCLARKLNKPGCLAAQMPLSHQQRSHELIAESLLALDLSPTDGTIEALVEEIRRPWMLEPLEYHTLLSKEVDQVQTWTTEYFHVLSGEDAVVNWVLGTALRPVIKHLSNHDCARFIEHYSRLIRKEYPCRDDGTVWFPYRRLFIIASNS